MDDEFNISQDNLIKALVGILPNHRNYVNPVIRADGDIVIPLEPALKKSVGEMTITLMSRQKKKRK